MRSCSRGACFRQTRALLVCEPRSRQELSTCLHRREPRPTAAGGPKRTPECALTHAARQSEAYRGRARRGCASKAWRFSGSRLSLGCHFSSAQFVQLAPVFTKRAPPAATASGNVSWRRSPGGSSHASTSWSRPPAPARRAPPPRAMRSCVVARRAECTGERARAGVPCSCASVPLHACICQMLAWARARHRWMTGWPCSRRLQVLGTCLQPSAAFAASSAISRYLRPAAVTNVMKGEGRAHAHARAPLRARTRSGRHSGMRMRACTHVRVRACAQHASAHQSLPPSLPTPASSIRPAGALSPSHALARTPVCSSAPLLAYRRQGPRHVPHGPPQGRPRPLAG